jgi:hypothetical protein
MPFKNWTNLSGFQIKTTIENGPVIENQTFCPILVRLKKDGYQKWTDLTDRSKTGPDFRHKFFPYWNSSGIQIADI